jgi:hypothetical protein
MFLRLALMTSLVYVGTACIVQALWYLVVYWKGEAIPYGTRLGWLILFGLL